MDRIDAPDPPRPAWHALLAPLPAGARPVRKPIAPPEVLASPEGSVIAGWTSVTLEFSAPGRGLRHLLVTLDETGRPLSASDHVLFRAPNPEAPAGPADMRQESIGGRLEADGTFRGTHWLVTGPEPAVDEQPAWDMRSRAPNEEEIVALKALVDELLGRLDG
jgi:hypothetical protein